MPPRPISSITSRLGKRAAKSAGERGVNSARGWTVVSSLPGEGAFGSGAVMALILGFAADLFGNRTALFDGVGVPLGKSAGHFLIGAANSANDGAIFWPAAQEGF